MNVGITYTASTGGFLEVFFSEDAFGPAGVDLSASVTYNQTMGSAAYTGALFYDDAEGLGEAGAVTPIIGYPGALLGAGGSFSSGTAVNSVPGPVGSYSLTAYLAISAGAGASGDADANILRKLPDGGSTVAFLGMALMAVEGMRRKFAKA
jgi:hypothetical protein